MCVFFAAGRRGLYAGRREKNLFRRDRKYNGKDNRAAWAAVPQTTQLPFDVAGAIGFSKQAQFHPLKFVAGIAGGLKIYERTPVKELMKNKAVTETGTIHFEKCIFATHFPIDNKHGMYFLKMYQHRSYVIALEHAAALDGMYVDEAMCGMSFRNYRKLLLIGGGDHRTGKGEETGRNSEILPRSIILRQRRQEAGPRRTV